MGTHHLQSEGGEEDGEGGEGGSGHAAAGKPPSATATTPSKAPTPSKTPKTPKAAGMKEEEEEGKGEEEGGSEGGDENPRRADGQSEQAAIEDAFGDAMAAQPTGYTLETTSVKTKVGCPFYVVAVVAVVVGGWKGGVHVLVTAMQRRAQCLCC